MHTDGSDDTPSAEPPAHHSGPTAHDPLRLIPGAGTGERPRRPYRTDRIEAVPDVTSVSSPWLRSDDDRGPWTRDEIRRELQVFLGCPTGEFLTIDERIALADLLLSEHSPIVFDGYCGLFWPNQVLAPDLVSRLTETRVAQLRLLPEALRAWVRYCHRNDPWIDADMTLAVLDGIDIAQYAWHDALDREHRRRCDDRPFHLHKLAEYAADVGGVDALWLISTEPLPDEELQLQDLDPDTTATVLAVAARCDEFFSSFSDLDGTWMGELRTVARRLVARLGRDAPKALRRPSTASLAAAVVYASIHGNVVPKRGGPLSTESIALTVGAGASGVAARARSLLGQLGVDQPAPEPDLPPRLRRRHLRLGSPALLIADRREFLASEAAYLAARLGETED
jgi:hypothetical protein